MDNRAKVQPLLREWYRERAERVFKGRFEVCCQAFGIDHLDGFTLRRMRKRWGSCSHDGRILLNTQLVGASKRCIDYVIVHELCHAVHHNHSAAFYALLGCVYARLAGAAEASRPKSGHVYLRL